MSLSKSPDVSEPHFLVLLYLQNDNNSSLLTRLGMRAGNDMSMEGSLQFHIPLPGLLLPQL